MPVLSINDNIIFEEQASNHDNNFYHRIRVYYSKTEKAFNKISDLFYTFSDTPIVSSDSSLIFLNTFNDQKLRECIYNTCDKYFKYIDPLLNKYDNNFENILFGMDFVLNENGSKLIEVNNHNSLSCSLVYYKKNCLKDFIDYMISRSYDFLLSEKTILIIGCGSFNKRHIFDYCYINKIKIILCDEKLKKLLEKYDNIFFIKTSIHKPEKFEMEVERIAKILIDGGHINIFSVITLCEDYVPLKILLQEKLNLKNHYSTTYQDSLINKDKILIYNRITSTFNKSNDFGLPRYKKIMPHSIPLDSDLDLIEIKSQKILKISTASGAFGCKRICNNEELKQGYSDLHVLISTTSNDFGVGVQYSPKIFLSDFIEGTEHDLDIVLCRGEVKFYVFTDNISIPKDHTSFTELGCVIPSEMIIDRDQKLMYVDIITSALKACNLTHGVFNVEFILSKMGIKIIDINPRPGGYYINDWIRKIFGTDTFKCEILLNSPLNNLIINNESDSLKITGKSIYHEEQLKNEDYDCIFMCLENLQANGLDMVAEIGKFNIKY